MEEKIEPSLRTALVPEPPRPLPIFSVLSGLFIIAAIVFAGKGWYTLYDNSYDARIVGGDAYNSIIYATRGTAVICIGIVCAVLSGTFALFAHTTRKT
jgi:hypothetical protein